MSVVSKPACRNGSRCFELGQLESAAGINLMLAPTAAECRSARFQTQVATARNYLNEYMKQFQTCRIPEPRRYFLLETPSFSVEIAANPRLVALFRRVKTGAEWEAMGINPYDIRQFETDPEDWSSHGFGVDDVEGIRCRFSPVFPTVEKGCAQAIRDGSRFVADYYKRSSYDDSA